MQVTYDESLFYLIKTIKIGGQIDFPVVNYFRVSLEIWIFRGALYSQTTSNHMKLTKHCLIFAHRGANREATENTQIAFDCAVNYVVDGIETDVQLTRDDIPVLWHDRSLEKVGLPDKQMDDFDYEQVKRLHFSDDNQPINIMRLQDFLDSYRQSCRLLIEIKNRDYEPTTRHQLKVRLTLELIGSSDTDAIFVSSFHLASLKYAHLYQTNIPLIYNLESDQTVTDVEQVLTTCPFIQGFCLPIDIVDDAMVQLIRKQNKWLAVYTCNSDDEINKALNFEVDILISDLPRKTQLMRQS